MLKSKHKADVSLTPGEIFTPEEKSKKTLKYRRSSAPITDEEAEIAHKVSGKFEISNDSKDDFVMADPVIPDTRQEIEDMRKELLGEITRNDSSEENMEDTL